MYKRSSPEALSLASLGRADSKRPDKTCRGITTAGKPCRKALKKGAREKYCHLHRDQQTFSRSSLLGATRTVVEVDEDDFYEPAQRTRVGNSSRFPPGGYPMATPSPSPPREVPPSRRPVPSITYPPVQHIRSPSLQLSPPASTIRPPTPPSSIHSPELTPVQPRPNKGFFKFGKTLRNLFRTNPEKTKSKKLSKIPKSSGPHSPTLKTAIRINDLSPSRYPLTIVPSGRAGMTSHSPARRPPVHKQQYLPPSPQRTPKSGKSAAKVPPVRGRPPTAVLLLAQSRSAITGVQRSWETMWVPGIDGLGAHIICKGILPPLVTLLTFRVAVSAFERRGFSKDFELYACTIKCRRRTWLHLRLQNLRYPLPFEVASNFREQTASNRGVFYKVGRTQNLTRRLYQWSRSCPYYPLLVEFFPTPPTSPLRRSSSTSSLYSLFRKDDESSSTPSRAETRIVKCAVTHRIERLIHLELEDRFGRVDISPQGCPCGKVHKEWFRGGIDAEAGWQEVRDVIVRWIGFARVAYGEVVV